MQRQLVYITVGAMEEARTIASALVNERLAACANIFPKMHSIYRWQGKICEDEEVVLIVKTDKRKFGVLKKRVETLHSYECPCIVSLDIADGNSAFLNWIGAQISDLNED